MCRLALVCCAPYILPCFIFSAVPIYGIFCGKELVLRLSLVLCLLSCFSATIRGRLSVFEPLLRYGMLLSALLLPYTLVPHSVVWLYDKVLCLSEPVWLVLEALAIVQLSMYTSRQIMDRMDDQPEIAKGSIVSISAVAYSLSIWFTWTILASEYTVYKWILLGIILGSMIIHIVTFMKDEGVISDAAMTAVCSVAMCYDVYTRREVYGHRADVPQEWKDDVSHMSYLNILVKIAWSGVGGSAGHMWQLVVKLISPWFLSCAFLRGSSILYSVTLFKQYCYNQDDDVNVDLEEDSEDPGAAFAHWFSPLPIKLAAIFVYTQFLIFHFYGPLYEDASWIYWIVSWFPSGRWIQIVLLNAYYLYKLHRTDCDDDLWG